MHIKIIMDSISLQLVVNIQRMKVHPEFFFLILIPRPPYSYLSNTNDSLKVAIVANEGKRT